MNYNPIEIEKALYFLADCIRIEKRTSKPLMLHCTKVGMMLLDDGQSTDVIVGGILHDVLEDTNCTEQELRTGFGDTVTELVKGCSFQPERKDILRTSNTSNYQEEWTREFDGMEVFDDQVLLIKTADIYDNSSLVSQITDKGQRDNLIWKHREFVRRFKERLANNQIFQNLKIKVNSY